jgi:hypothetical protein
MSYKYNYRLGLLIQREGKIDVITENDLKNLYSIPSIVTFQPISLSHKVLSAFGFKRSKEKYERYFYYYSKYDLLLFRRPFTSGFYFPEIPSSPTMNFAHELQDFLRFIPPFNIFENYRLQDFILNYGSKKLKIYDQ